jgi:hypothetical protein
MNTRTRLTKNYLPKTISKISHNIFRTKEEILEIEHLERVTMYDFKLGNLLFNAIKSEKKANQDLAGIQF